MTDMGHTLPNILYHYCSLQSLRGIIQTNCLYMTSVFYDVVNRVLSRRPADERNAVHEQFQNMVKHRKLTYVFCTCFSEDPDSRSQWLEYADDGHGFAIGFDPTAFDLKRRGPERDFELKPVIYDESEQEQMAEELIRHLRERGHNTWWQAPLCKNPAFKNEEEWRLVCRDDPGDALDFRDRAGRQLIPFIRFPFDPEKQPIREIWLGPRNKSQRNVDAVVQLLRRWGYDTDKVRFPGSNIPLRPEYS
jgi:hypothetical protein